MELFTKSNSQMTKALSLGALVLGLVLFFLSRHSAHPEASSALWLGYFLIACGPIFWLFIDDVSVWVDDKTEALQIEKKNFFHHSLNRFSFAEVECVRALRMGRTQGPLSYQLVIVLKNSQQINTGRWSFDQSEITHEAETLAQILKCKTEFGLIVQAMDSNINIAGFSIHQIILAIVISVVMYAIWYRCQVGAWCPAMWHGTAPVVIIGLGFVASLRVLRRIPRE